MKEVKIEIEKKLVSLAESVIHGKKYSNEFSYLLRKFKITEKELVRGVVNYTLNVREMKNEEYSSNTMRMVLYLHNLVDGTYHQLRQRAVVDFIKNINPNTAIEVGFGVPSRYVFDLTLKYGKPKLLLIDADVSAIDFAKVLLEYKNPKWMERVDFKVMNMDDQEFVGRAGAYIFMDSIEHTKDPTKYLRKLVRLSPQDSCFIFSLPISSIRMFKHMHHMEWINENDAEKWLNKCGLFIRKKIIAKPNPKVDFFADLLGGTFYNIVVLTDKINK